MKKLLSTLSIFFLAFQVFAQVNLTNGLVAYYPFNGNANDASGNGNNGTISNTFTNNNRLGNSSSVLSFDGINSYAYSNSSTISNLGSDATISFWIYMPTAIKQKSEWFAVSCDDPYNYTWWIFRSGGITTATSTNLKLQLKNGLTNPSNDIEINIFDSTKLNQWNHVLFYKQNTTLGIYFNNSLITTTSSISYQFLNPNSKIYFGKNNLWNLPFVGMLDEFRIYNRALNSDEITALYDEGKTTQTITGFNPPSTTTYGSTFSLNASASSGLAVTYSSSNTSIVGVSGNLATATGVGVVTLTATQVGNVSVAGTSLTSVITVTKANLIVQVNNSTKFVGQNNPTFTSSVSGLNFNDLVNIAYVTSANVSSGVGTYPVYASVTGASLSKYNLTTVAGTLTVAILTELQSIYPNATISIFPNPTNGILSVIATNVTISSIEVYNSQGVLVQTQSGSNINISAQPAGIYTIWLKDNQNRYLASQKVVKK